MQHPDWYNNLPSFIGTNAYHIFSPIYREKIVCTDGALYLAQRGECFWLLDLIASYQGRLNDHDFQVWTYDPITLCVKCDNGSGQILISQQLDYSDLTLPVKLYCCVGHKGHVILLPSEY